MSTENKKETLETESTQSTQINKKFAIIVISIFISLLVIPSIAWLIASPFLHNDNFEERENRKRAEITSFNPATLTTQLEAFYNDRVPFRSFLIDTNNNFNKLIERPYNKTIFPFLVKLSNKGKQETVIQKEEPSDIDEIFLNIKFDVPTIIDNGNASCTHLLSTETKEATCDSFGTVTESCSNCSYKKCTYSKKNAHNGTLIESGEATIDAHSFKTYHCETCQSDYTEYGSKIVDTSFMPPRIFNEKALLGRNNWLFYAAEKSINYYRGEGVLTPQEMDQRIATLEKLQALCEQKGITLQYMIMPNKEEVYSEYMPTYTFVSEKKKVETFVDYVAENSKLEIIYPYKELTAIKPLWPTYHKYDTHWNDIGAFIGTQALYKKLGIPLTDLRTIPVYEAKLRRFDIVALGALDVKDYQNDVSYDIEYRPEITVTSKYGVAKETIISTSNSENKANFVMLGDSFRGDMVKFLQKDFSSCVTTHRSKINDSDVQEAIVNADILVLACVGRYDDQLVTYAEKLIAILEAN